MEGERDGRGGKGKRGEGREGGLCSSNISLKKALGVSDCVVAVWCASMLSWLCATVSYVTSQFVCLAIDVLLIFIVDGISKNILSEIRSILVTSRRLPLYELYMTLLVLLEY